VTEASTAAETSTVEDLLDRMGGAVPCSSRNEVLDLALRHLPDDGLVCEFGVFEGASINHIAARIPHRTVFGFDSFEGLPERWREAFGPGAFTTEGRLPEVLPNVRLLKGWFEEALPAFAARHPGPVALLHVDCDLYSSTRCVLEHLGGSLVPGSVVVFDEYFNYPGWEQHEFRAFSEFAEERRLGYEYLAYNRLHEQVAVRVTG
jgi:Macrocin-O-methyltransferase (TylF)